MRRRFSRQQRFVESTNSCRSVSLWVQYLARMVKFLASLEACVGIKTRRYECSTATCRITLAKMWKSYFASFRHRVFAKTKVWMSTTRMWCRCTETGLGNSCVVICAHSFLVRGVSATTVLGRQNGAASWWQFFKKSCSCWQEFTAGGLVTKLLNWLFYCASWYWIQIRC